MANETKEKKITLDFSDELIDLVKETSSRNGKETNVKLKEVKELILSIVEREINHIDSEFAHVSVNDRDYDLMIEKLDKWADVIRYW